MSLSSDYNIRQLHHFFEHSVDTHPGNIAVVCDTTFLSYHELECRANQLAQYLHAHKIRKGCVVGILLERSIECYIAILATLKTGAVYVPIEVDYPDERINYIFADLAFDAVLTSATQFLRKNLIWPSTYVLETHAKAISKQSEKRLPRTETEQSLDDRCYIIYTSGSTGKPKGVEITHRSICHYVRVASALYGMTQYDRVYQGFSLAFDASLEELWMAFANGAALIACTEKEVRSGLGLIAFLQQHHVSVFSTVPTLLGGIEGTLPDLRLLILGGENCPESLIKRWSKKDLRIINTYGPTEATVIATYAECHPEKEVTIGQALPGYELLIVDEQLREVPDGEKGELCIGGIALAQGYVNQEQQTQKQFILNPANKNQRLYRTGDLVSRDELGDIHFFGRIDSQVKLRGFRIELNEIEAVIMQYAGVKQAVVSLHMLDQPMLVAYVIAEHNKLFDVHALKHFLRSSLPDYMLPSFIEILDVFPVLASGKVDRKKLPLPVVQKINQGTQAAKTQLAEEIAQVWEDVLGCSAVSVDAHFFYDLGGHSLHAAQVISSLRKIPALKSSSILDLYKNPTIKQLEKKFTRSAHAAYEHQEDKKYTAPQWSYYLCGIGQFFGCLLQYALGILPLLVVLLCYSWTSSGASVISSESRWFCGLLFLAMPILSLLITVGLKWLLLGRVKPGEYPLWGWFYYRWWLVQRLQKNLFLARFLPGSPLASMYHRLLGAKIGKDCYIGSMQLCTHDLLSIADRSSIGADSRLNGYIVEDGWLKIGSIHIGSHCYIGARAVIGRNTRIGDHAVLDEMSMLPDQSFIPQGAYFSGSPAISETLPADHITRQLTSNQKSTFLGNVLFGLLHYLGIVFIMAVYYACLIPAFLLMSYSYDHYHYATTMFCALPLGTILFLGLYYACLILCKKFIMSKTKPGHYPLKSFYYLRHWILIKMFDCDEVSIMADTLYMPAFLRLLGAKLGKGVEMGESPHIVPDLVSIEEEGFTASSVALAWPKVHHGLISFAPVRIGRRAFAGNVSLLSAGKTLGEGALLGCLSMIPSGDKAKAPHASWLGSPAVFLPNRESFKGFSDQDKFYPSKKLYGTRLLIEFMRIMLPTTFSLMVLFQMLYVIDYMLQKYSWLATALALPPAELLFTLCLFGVLVGLKWLMLGKLKPLTKPIWDSFIWKNDVIEYSYNYFVNTHLTNKILGTPFALWVPRCFGTKAGRRVFTDSAEFSEFDLITLGDEVCINAETIIQTHLYEDRIFKVSHVTISSGCTIGVGSIVLYNTLMEKNATLGSLSLLMKGERLPENTRWAGIPAQSIALSAPYQHSAPEPVAGNVSEHVIPELS